MHADLRRKTHRRSGRVGRIKPSPHRRVLRICRTEAVLSHVLFDTLYSSLRCPVGFLFCPATPTRALGNERVSFMPGSGRAPSISQSFDRVHISPRLRLLPSSSEFLCCTLGAEERSLPQRVSCDRQRWKGYQASEARECGVSRGLPYQGGVQRTLPAFLLLVTTTG